MKRFWINLKGKSMSPLLRENDQILIESTEIENLKCGEVILYFDPLSNELTLHRLIEIPLKTKGDLNLASENISRDSYFGRAIGFKRDLYYRTLPSRESVLNNLFLFCSKLRTKGFIQRKIAHLLLIIIARVFLSCSEKTRLSHSEELALTDLSSRV